MPDNGNKEGIETSTESLLRPTISKEKLALFQRRLREGYDLPDSEFDAWKAKATSSEAPTADSPVGITVSYDMGWQKRGRAMNSLTGVGVNIGLHTGKVLGYATRNKRCITCDVAERHGREPTKHDCRKNHWGSSKSMEPSVAAELAKKVSLSSSGKVNVAVMVGDDDCATIKHVNDCVGHVTKQSDIGHCKRSL